MLAWKRNQWRPSQLPGLLGWFTTGRNYVVINGTNEATSWLNFPNGSIPLASTGGDEPDWKQNGWGQGVSSIDFSVGGAEVLSTTTASIVAPGNGTDLPFSLFCTLQLDSTSDQTILGWRHSAAASLSVLRITNPAMALQYRRTDSGSNTADVSTGVAFGTARRRVGVLHSGTAVSLFVETVEAGSGASNVGALTCDNFQVGNASEPFSGRVADMVVLNRLASPGEYLAYYNWSVTNLGY